MRDKLAFILLLVFVSGCATAGRSSRLDSQMAQNRIAFLENEMKAKDQEIGELKDEVRQIRSQVSRRVDVYDADSRRSSQTASYSQSNSNESEAIIRVDGVAPDQVQLALKRAGFYQGPLDGKIGAKTKDAIKAFQKANSLTVDGVVGRGTWAKLKTNL